MEHIDHIIAGKAYRAPRNPTAAVFNPASGEQVAVVSLGGADEVHLAVANAHDAGKAWAATPPAKRANVMFAMRELMQRHRDDIARAISREHGKTHDDALGEVARALEVVEFASGIAHHLKGSFSREVANSVDVYAERAPLGVVAGITPFNFPAMVPLWMIPMALACGNSFVLKPSERDPSVTTLIHDLFAEAGLPAGVFNIVHGGKEAVDALLDHPLVKAVSFVGSTPIARYIYTRGTAAGKRVQALGGAKNHMVILPDADLDQAADALLGAGFGSAGERCMAVSVAVPVGEETADQLIARLAPRVASLKIGPATDSDADMGPLITAAHRDKVVGYIDAGEAEGAKVVVDGRGFRLQGYEQGFWVGGTLLDRVEPHMQVYREEIFGPVLSVVRAPDYATAAALIDGHEYANGTAIFTRDGDAARDFAARIEVGMVGVNVPIPVPVGYHSFGGWKSSIFGAHGIYGPEAVHFYTRLKTVTSRWPTGIRAGAEFKFPSLNG
ncbi:CoA-acylating methylmalonate-semialdehyde dehydrogenase [Sphingopyxis sp. SE2]|uniref:CoA-acylating methylmalonate-semialdehyde dehydrogenase n=1 Tax=Sphingopyxis sp. SE2 TaxID=1586240 RepID=UPI0028C27BB9|nr:CoA-acylating methylmalonate-semialdehyde dehydrogenase [Sphingopyxis sp. SE2]MDT7531619.1 CoA-acylating methylmalonate-semialdehyde dehydrogenase [Sphingopyxis sp. SE2]